MRRKREKTETTRPCSTPHPLNCPSLEKQDKHQSQPGDNGPLMVTIPFAVLTEAAPFQSQILRDSPQCAQLTVNTGE